MIYHNEPTGIAEKCAENETLLRSSPLSFTEKKTAEAEHDRNYGKI